MWSDLKGRRERDNKIGREKAEIMRSKGEGEKEGGREGEIKRYEGRRAEIMEGKRRERRKRKEGGRDKEIGREESRDNEK